MSKIIWKKTFIPDLTKPCDVLQNDVYNSQVENTRAYPVASQDLSIPDPKAFRSMSRAAIFLSHLGMQAQQEVGRYTDISPFSVGIYCAVENGPIDAPSTRKVIDQNDPEHFADSYRRFRNPKMYLKQLPNLVPAQMGISLNIQGPMNVYTHSTMGGIQALEQAEWDLNSKVVEAAFVCSSFAFDDFLVLKRSRHYDSRTINEGAAAALLVSNGHFTDWSSLSKIDKQNTFGISNQLISILEGE